MREAIAVVQELTRAVMRDRTAADLIRTTFRVLTGPVPFDLGVVVMVEQNLDVYVCRPPDVEDPLSDRFAGEVRKIVQGVLNVSFGETDLLIQGNFPDLPAQEIPGDVFARSIAAPIEQESRIAGVVILFRHADFAPEAEGLLEFAASQISLVLGRIRITERIQNLADTDELTGIWNKRWLRRQLPNEIERSRIYGVPLSLAMFDVDDFKMINDRWGHVVGDVLLSELCGTVRETLRPPDMFARFGGDEFAVVLPHSDLYGARAVADRILQRTRALRLFVGEEIRCTVSVGIATYVPPSMTAAELIERADERLYESKRLGKDRVTW
ncbi:MAG: diguanylate cyclase [Thermoanaerobaculia bacterium]